MSLPENPTTSAFVAAVMEGQLDLPGEAIVPAVRALAAGGPTPTDAHMNALLEHLYAHAYLSAAVLVALVVLLVVEFRMAAQSFAAVSPIEATRLANAGALLLIAPVEVETCRCNCR